MERAIVPDVGDARRRATYDDLIAVPEHLIAEIIDGELITSPRPAPPHALACSGILSVLFDRFNGPPGGGESSPGGWWILYEPELHFGDDVLVPDLAGWRRDRMPDLPEIAYFTLAPDWVCEVISPSSGRLDRVRQMPIYARERVEHVWLVVTRGRRSRENRAFCRGRGGSETVVAGVGRSRAWAPEQMTL
jgi:Uma2 family endonuclease